jgi:hypothetical protein
MNGANVQPALVLGETVWCSVCQDYVKIVRVTSAAKIADSLSRYSQHWPTIGVGQ